MVHFATHGCYNTNHWPLAGGVTLPSVLDPNGLLISALHATLLGAVPTAVITHRSLLVASY
eukprot:COSAG02_NODE_6329_length_3646_cov_45.575416_2_plen_61_part_00